MVTTELAEVSLVLTMCLSPRYNPVRAIINAILQMRTAGHVEVR